VKRFLFLKTLKYFTLAGFVVLFLFMACDNPLMKQILDAKTITFNSNGGSSVPSQTLLRDETIKKPADPIKADCIFHGWFSDNNTFYNKWDFNTAPTGDLTLYAMWEETIPERRPVQARWYSWTFEGSDTEPPSAADVNFSVAPDGLCTINVIDEDSTANRWKATVNYEYTARANTSYEYVFQAWKESEGNPTRELSIAYYNEWDGDGTILEIYNIEIDSTVGKTYTMRGQLIPKGRIGSLEFRCADQQGTFYVKIISIKPVEPFNDIGSYNAWLGDLPNTPDAAFIFPYYVKLNNVNSSDLGIIKNILKDNSNTGKYVFLDISSSSITVLPPSAFQDCDTIYGITLPANLTSIGNDAFGICWSLNDLIIPSSVMSIGDYAFNYCSSLTGITVPAGTIGSNAFFSTGLTGVIIGSGVTSIGNEAFGNCDNLKSVTFAGGSVTIGDYSFPPGDFGMGGSDALKSIYNTPGTGGAGTYTRPLYGDWSKQL